MISLDSKRSLSLLLYLYQTIPKPLRDKLGEDASESLVEFINEATRDARENIILLAEERFEGKLTTEASRLRTDLDKRITEEVAKLRVEMGALRTDIASSKAEIIKWIFLFWIGQLVVIAGLLKFIR